MSDTQKFASETEQQLAQFLGGKICNNIIPQTKVNEYKKTSSIFNINKELEEKVNNLKRDLLK